MAVLSMLSRDDIYFCILRIFQEENWPNALFILGQKLPASYIVMEFTTKESGQLFFNFSAS